MSGNIKTAEPVMADSDSFKVGQHVSSTELIDDTVTCVATITALLPRHVAKISTVVTKQDGTVVMDGVSTVKLPGSLMKPVITAPAKAA
jgi:hypothetical protein